jgi:hypothetical protein
MENAMTAAKQTPQSSLPWFRQTHFLIACVVIALLVGSHFGPNDSNASIAPPSIEAPAPTIEPAPVAPPVVVQAPAPTPPASPVTVINVIGQDKQEAPQIIRELQPIIYRQLAPSPSPSPSPEPAIPEPSPTKSVRSEHCQQMLAEHQQRVAQMKATLHSYHP